MNAESEAWDEIADRLVVIYNHMRLTRSDLAQHQKGAAKAEAEIVRLEDLASTYEALLSTPDTHQGITA